MRRGRGWGAALLVAVLVLGAALALDLDLSALSAGWSRAARLTAEAWPPDLRVLEPSAWPPCEAPLPLLCSPAWTGLSETLAMALLATVLGTVAALPLAVAAARNLGGGGGLGRVARALLAAIRVLPSLLWAVLFVVVVGLGPLAGVLAMTVYTVGFMGKLQYEAFEGLPSEPLDAGRAMGLPGWLLARHVALPESANALWSQALFMLEYNVRHGSVVGLVGAGGIGYTLDLYLKMALYDRVLALLLVMLAAVLAIDAASHAVRRRFLDARASPGRSGKP